MVDWDVVMKIANEWYDKFDKVGKLEDLYKRQQGIVAVEKELTELQQQTVSAGSLAREVLLSGKSIRQITSERMAGILISMMVPGVSKAVAAEDKSVMLSEMGQLAIAIARFERTNGHYPDRLAGLRPQFVSRIPIDIFSRKPILYIKKENGFCVYSVGPDSKDSKGAGKNDRPTADDIAISITPVDAGTE